MAKGDFIEVVPLAGPPVRLMATRNGRRVEREYRTRVKTQWLDVTEVTRGGRPTGSSMSVRLDQLVAVVESRAPKEETPHAKQARQGQTRARRIPPAADRDGPATT